MTLQDETRKLRLYLGQLYGEEETALVDRYDPPPVPPAKMRIYRRYRAFVGRQLRALGLRKVTPPEPWRAGLKHRDVDDDARPLLIWAVGQEQQAIRAACDGFRSWLEGRRDIAPVLVTDVADFAYYSRLGWLVEYLPEFSSPADNYAARKRRYIAWRYRGAPALPLSAGLQDRRHIEELLLEEQ